MGWGSGLARAQGRTPAAASSSGAASPPRCARPRSTPLSPEPRGGPRRQPHVGSDPGPRWTVGYCAPGGGGGESVLGTSPTGSPKGRGGPRAGGGASPYLLGAAGGSHPPLPSGGRGSSQVFLNEMVSGARPGPFGPWPHPPHCGLQVLEDDGAVVVEHVGDAAGAEPGPARPGPQQRQQEHPQRGLRGPLQRIARHSVEGASAPAAPQACPRRGGGASQLLKKRRRRRFCKGSRHGPGRLREGNTAGLQPGQHEGLAEMGKDAGLCSPTHWML